MDICQSRRFEGQAIKVIKTEVYFLQMMKIQIEAILQGEKRCHVWQLITLVTLA